MISIQIALTSPRPGEAGRGWARGRGGQTPRRVGRCRRSRSGAMSARRQGARPGGPRASAGDVGLDRHGAGPGRPGANMLDVDGVTGKGPLVGTGICPGCSALGHPAARGDIRRPVIGAVVAALRIGIRRHSESGQQREGECRCGHPRRVKVFHPFAPVATRGRLTASADCPGRLRPNCRTTLDDAVESRSWLCGDGDLCPWLGFRRQDRKVAASLARADLPERDGRQVAARRCPAPATTTPNRHLRFLAGRIRSPVERRALGTTPYVRGASGLQMVEALMVDVFARGR